MRHNAKKGFLFSLAGLGLMAGMSVGLHNTSKKETNPILTNTIRYVNDTSASDEEDGKVEEKEGKTYITYKDSDGDGIPDALNEYIQSAIDKGIIDQTFYDIFKVCLSAVGLVFSIAYLCFVMSKKMRAMRETATEANKNVTNLSKTQETTTSQINDLKEQTQQFQKIHEEDVKQINELKAQIESLTKSNTETTSKYSNIGNLLTTILTNQSLLADTPENTINGNNAKVKANVKGALNYGEKES